jgi:fatty acid hydroxylase domain-containing protein 2
VPKVGFRYTDPPWTQHAFNAVTVPLALLVMALPPVQRAWAAFVVATPTMVLLIVVPLLIHAVVFWTVGGAFHYVDTYDRPELIAKYRIQSGKRRQPAWSKLWRNLAWNQLIWSPFMLGLMAAALMARGWTASPAFPPAWQILLELAGMGASAVVIFYTTHRFLHRPWWMKKVHRVHHEFRTTCAFASEYAHPVEMCVANFGTLAGGVVIIAPSLPSIYLFLVLALCTVLVHHSGYAVPWASWAVHHDWHHYRYKEAFGTIGVLDHLFGTSPELDAMNDGDER